MYVELVGIEQQISFVKQIIIFGGRNSICIIINWVRHTLSAFMAI
jgi:hypothetical protein